MQLDLFQRGQAAKLPPPHPQPPAEKQGVTLDPEGLLCTSTSALVSAGAGEEGALPTPLPRLG